VCDYAQQKASMCDVGLFLTYKSMLKQEYQCGNMELVDICIEGFIIETQKTNSFELHMLCCATYAILYLILTQYTCSSGLVSSYILYTYNIGICYL